MMAPGGNIYIVTYLTATMRVRIGVCDASDRAKLATAGLLVSDHGPYSIVPVADIDYAMRQQQSIVQGHTQSEAVN